MVSTSLVGIDVRPIARPHRESISPLDSTGVASHGASTRLRRILHAGRRVAMLCASRRIPRRCPMSSAAYPRLVQVVLDTVDVRGLAEFYRELLGLTYRAGDEPSGDPASDADWLVLVTDAGA